MDLTFRNVHNLCAGVDLSEDQPVIDLSAVTWFEPYALVYLGMFLRHHNRSGISFRLAYPKRPQARDYLTRQNFWERFRFTPTWKSDRSLIRAISTTSFNDIVDISSRQEQAEEVSHRLWGLISDNAARVSPKDVTEAAAELVDNFVQHADQGLGVLMVQYYPTYHCLRLAIGDCGIGIKHSLLRSQKYPHIARMSHRQAIVEAFTVGVTSKDVGGVGFEFVREIVCRCRAELFVSSFDGCVYIDNHGKMYTMDAPFDLPGVQVEISFPER